MAIIPTFSTIEPLTWSSQGNGLTPLGLSGAEIESAKQMLEIAPPAPCPTLIDINQAQMNAPPHYSLIQIRSTHRQQRKKE